MCFITFSIWQGQLLIIYTSNGSEIPSPYYCYKCFKIKKLIIIMIITCMQILKPNNADIFFSFCQTRSLPYFILHVLVIHIDMWSSHIMISLSLKKNPLQHYVLRMTKGRDKRHQRWTWSTAKHAKMIHST